MDTLTLHDFIAIGAQIACMAGTVAILKRDSVWSRRWQLKHEKDDDRRFHEVKEDLRELRHELRQAR